jgi:hypothetical protein
MGEREFKITLSEGHYDALMIIISEAFPYADDRDLSPVFSEMIDQYLIRERGRLGYVRDGKWEKRR